MQLSQPRARRPREPDPRVEFIPTPDFYDDEEVTLARNKYEDHINSSLKPCSTPLAWWQAHRNEYPRLSKMALDLFAIPMMSAECERVFSAAKNLVTERRMRLRDDIIEAMSLLRHWYKEEGVI